MDIRELLARNLNDHEDSKRGVRQNTFFTWSEQHVSQAVELALSYIYSLIPEEFTTVESLTVQQEDCIVSFCDACGKFMGVVDISILDERTGELVTCIELTEVNTKDEDEVNDIMSLMEGPCTTDEDEYQIPEEIEWEMVDSTQCVIKFDDPIPVGSVIRFTCATPPDIGTIDDDNMIEYMPIIAEFAASWLYKTDSESKSNLERARLHFAELQWLVETKLNTEFSLREDDSIYSRRKIYD